MTTVDDRCRLFFLDFFSTISNFSIFPKKVIGPEASEKHFGSSGGVREGIWGRPGGGAGGVLGVPGAVRGGLGGVLGGSWALLGRSWSDLGGSPSSDRIFDRF